MFESVSEGKNLFVLKLQSINLHDRVIATPVIYVFGEEDLDIDAVASTFRSQVPDKSAHVLLVSETPYQAYLGPLKSLLCEYPNLLTTVPAFAASEDNAPQELIVPSSLASSTHTERSEIPHRAHPPLRASLSDYILIHIGTLPPAAHLHLNTLFPSDRKPIIIDPVTSAPASSVSTPLARRYQTMMTARSASTIGILVNTLSLRSSSQLIDSLKSAIRNAGKKHYVIAVGKPNVAKLANFDVVDVWVIVGCARGGIIIDRYGEYFKPIVTPFELKLALKKQVEWSGGEWMLEFDRVLSMKDDDDEQEQSDQDETQAEDEDEAPEFDPVTGRYVSSRPLFQSLKTRKQHVDVEIEGTKPSDSAIISTNGNAGQLSTRGSAHYSTAAAYLQTRAFWRGLGSDFNDETDEEKKEEAEAEGAKLEEGRSGIARGYVNPDV